MKKGLFAAILTIMQLNYAMCNFPWNKLAGNYRAREAKLSLASCFLQYYVRLTKSRRVMMRRLWWRDWVCHWAHPWERVLDVVSGLGKGHVHPVNHAVVTIVDKSGGVSNAHENSQNAQENRQKKSDVPHKLKNFDNFNLNIANYFQLWQYLDLRWQSY